MPRHRYSTYFPLVFFLLDIICLNIGFISANIFRFDSILYTQERYLILQGLLNVLWLLVFFSTGMHEVDREQRLIDNLNKLLTALVINLAIVFALWFVTQPLYYSREHLFFTYLIFASLLVSWRIAWHFIIRYYRTKGFNIRNVVIAGYGDLAENMVSYIHSNPGIGYKLQGIFNDEGMSHRGVNHLGKIDEIEKYSEEFRPDIIFCLMNELGDKRVQELIDFAENNLIKVKIISQFSRINNRNLTVQNYGAIPVLNVNAIPLDIPINQALKRAFDIIFSGFVIVFILSWLIPLVGLLIRLESNGPVFFKQNRHGKGNKLFLCWKFRTMVVNSEADSRQATRNDIRITRVGSFLRKTSIDELPQFINVFLGDMSIVGPRPHPIKLNHEFQPKIEKFWQRHAVKPGITGLAQAKGFRGETSEHSAMSGRVRLDRFYIRNWTLFLDVKIILLTIVTVLRGQENAY